VRRSGELPRPAPEDGFLYKLLRKL
jgi:hypothetical protein